MTALEGAAERTPFRLLTRLFLRRLIDNDAISPRADRHESLAVLFAVVISAVLFATFFISTDYLAAWIQLPGPGALRALSDRFLFIAASITIGALAASIVWDGLALEARDAGVLAPLPIPARTIMAAKLAAVILFGTALAVGLNAVPSVLHPLFLTINIRGARVTTVVRLIAAHATTVTMAGCFGFFGVLTVRGVARLLLGERAFRSTSSGIQSALVVCMVTALLLAPTVRDTTVRNWVGRATTAPVAVSPALWYLGLNETQGGDLVAELPIVLPPGFKLGAAQRRQDESAREVYRALLPGFARLAPRAVWSFLLVIVLGLATFIWTNRRLPDRSARTPARQPVRSWIRRVAERLTQRDPEAQAGFFFSLQTLSRSSPHRTVLTLAVSAGLTHALLVLTQQGWHAVAGAPLSLGALAISPVFLMAVLIGVRYAVTVPAQPASRWMIQLAWLGGARSYLAGVKRAGLLLVAALLLAVLPLEIAERGVAIALVHTLLASVLAFVVLDALFLSYRKVPFACSYIPIQNPKVVWPLGFTGVVLVSYGFAAVERWASYGTVRTAALFMMFGAVALMMHLVDGVRRRQPLTVTFDDRPAPATQRLGLLEHVTMTD